VNGWDRGNGYAELLLSAIEYRRDDSNPGDYRYQQADLTRWNRELRRLVALAEEYR
jgi:hypothetical protein